MELTTEILSRFAGGQLEIQNRDEGYLFRGEIERACIEDGKIKVRFSWIARWQQGGNWVNHGNPDYAVSLKLASASDIGNGRIAVLVRLTGELATFFPPGYHAKLARERVRGLAPAAS